MSMKKTKTQSKNDLWMIYSQKNNFLSKGANHVSTLIEKKKKIVHKRRSEAEQTETMVDRDKQEANDNINGSMKKSNSEREQTEVAFFYRIDSGFFNRIPNNRV